MKAIAIFPNAKKRNISNILNWMITYLTEQNVRILMSAPAAIQLGYPELAYDFDADIPQDVLLAITLGGDGTLLSAARKLAASGVAICGVNMGQLGFLTDVELPELSRALDKLITGDYQIEERMMLDAVVMRGKKKMYLSTALNDVVITRSGFSRMIRLKLYVNNELTENYAADGLIAATPTGSTGYSLSAGGPIIHPSLHVISITPICPHTLHARTLLVSDQEELLVKLQQVSDDIVLTIDGQTVHHLLPDDQIYIKRSPFTAKFVKFSEQSYYTKLRTKLRRGK